MNSITEALNNLVSKFNTNINTNTSVECIDKMTTTENGALAFESTGSKCLDLFFNLIRDTDKTKCTQIFYDAWLEDPKTAIKILLHCRDCRKGKGERLIVLYCLYWLRKHKPITYLKNLVSFLNVGYYKDLLNMAKQVEHNMDPNI